MIVLLILGIVSVWLCFCVLAVSLCVMARRADEALVAAERIAVEPEVGFVATFAEPEPVTAPRGLPRAGARTGVR